MSSPSADEATLDRALRELTDAWAIAGEGWQDAARTEFERDHLDDIQWRGRQGMKALGELSALCAEAMRRCS